MVEPSRRGVCHSAPSVGEPEKHCGRPARLQGGGNPVMLGDEDGDPGRKTGEIDEPGENSPPPGGGILPRPYCPLRKPEENLVEQIEDRRSPLQRLLQSDTPEALASPTRSCPAAETRRS